MSTSRVHQIEASGASYTLTTGQSRNVNSYSNCSDIVIRHLKAMGMAALASGGCVATGGLLLHSYFHYPFYPNEGYRNADLYLSILCFLGAAYTAVITYRAWVVDANY